MRNPTRYIARTADMLMHAAQHIAGETNRGNYGSIWVWNSHDPAVILLRDEYQRLIDMLDTLYFIEDHISELYSQYSE